MSTETFDRIKKWAKLINRKPNYDCTHFYLSDNEKTMIIDLTRMEVMPPILKALSEKEKSYLFIDLDDDKMVRYYAYDICPQSFLFVREKMGTLLFNIVESDILKYIENNISELTTEKTPMTALVEMCKGDFQKITSTYQPANTSRYEGHTPYGSHMGGTPSQHAAWTAASSSNNYNSSYKERDQFMETLYSLIKQGRTGPAVDHIREFISNKESDLEMLNNVFRFISLDKLDFISMRELFLTTESVKSKIVERASILAKVQSIVNKAKPKKAKFLLREIQPNV